MKKVKVSEASGVVLDYLVSKADNPPGQCGWGWWERDVQGFLYDPLNEIRYSPSTDWSQGGPIIEREELDLCNYTSRRVSKVAELWLATKGVNDFRTAGSTPLIAAMRCYVSSKLGEEVEIPDEV